MMEQDDAQGSITDGEVYVKRVAMAGVAEQRWVTEIFLQLSECRGAFVGPCETSTKGFKEQ